MSPRAIRRVVWVVGFGGLVGIIVASIISSTGLAIFSGIISALSVCALILVTSVLGPAGFRRDDGTGPAAGYDPARAADVERCIQRLVADGADEEAVRQLVTRAVELGQAHR
jgi:hypothetical protein